MTTYSTIMETDAMRDEPEAHLEMAISKLCSQIEMATGTDCRTPFAVALKVARTVYREKGPDMFGKPTPWLRRLFGRRPNYTKVEMGVDGTDIVLKVLPFGA